jgi:hypothetical protein
MSWSVDVVSSTKKGRRISRGRVRGGPNSQSTQKARLIDTTSYNSTNTSNIISVNTYMHISRHNNSDFDNRSHSYIFYAIRFAISEKHVKILTISG